MDRSGNSSDKGKDKSQSGAEDPTKLPGDGNPASTGGQSMTSRIAASASGLAQDIFGGPSGSASLTNALESSQARSEKSQSSVPSSSSSSSGHIQATAQSHQPYSSFRTPAGVSAEATERGHGGWAAEHMIEADYDGFVNGQARLPEASREGFVPPITDESPRATDSRSSSSQTHYQPQASDGAAVVALLASPGLTVQTDDPTSRLQNETPIPPLPPYAPTAAFNAPYNVESNRNPLNLIPASLLEGPHVHTHAETTNLATSREQWLRDWDGVLNAYTDEVWGDLLPAVRDAREEIENVKSGRENELGSQQLGAVARLQMMLGHLKGREGANGGAADSA
ncbi:MAG: hypothetical protein M1837_003935 [Sclerophora amabilis]|nr:MAG: hypothetical protein M1837_003935 [Sclerophora amabilis]